MIYDNICIYAVYVMLIINKTRKGKENDEY